MEKAQFRRCSKCKQNPVQFLCMNQICIKNNVNLFCRGCNKEEKKHHKTYIIDQQSAPLSLFALNSSSQNRQVFRQFLNGTIQKCTNLWDQKIGEVIVKHQTILQQEIFQHFFALAETCDEQKAQNVYQKMTEQSMQSKDQSGPKYFQQQSAESQQLRKNIHIMKWLQKHQSLIRDQVQCQKIIQNFTIKYEAGLNKMFEKMNYLFEKFLNRFNSKTLLAEVLVQTQVYTQKQTQQQKQKQKLNFKQFSFDQSFSISPHKKKIGRKIWNNDENKSDDDDNIDNKEGELKERVKQKQKQKQIQQLLHQREMAMHNQDQNEMEVQINQNQKQIIPAEIKLSQSHIRNHQNNQVSPIHVGIKLSQSQIRNKNSSKLQYFQTRAQNITTEKVANKIISQQKIKIPIKQRNSQEDSQKINTKEVNVNNVNNANLNKQFKANNIFKSPQVKIQAQTLIPSDGQNNGVLLKIKRQKQKLQKLQKLQKVKKKIPEKQKLQRLMQILSKKKPLRLERKYSPDQIYKLNTVNCHKFLIRDLKTIKCMYIQSIGSYFLRNDKYYGSFFSQNEIVQEMHIFQPQLTNERLCELLLMYPKLKALIINCDNLLQQFMWFIKDKNEADRVQAQKKRKQNRMINQPQPHKQTFYGMEVIQTSGIYYKDIQLIDSKKYFPQKAYCAKVLDQRWEQTKNRLKKQQKQQQVQVIQQPKLKSTQVQTQMRSGRLSIDSEQNPYMDKIQKNSHSYSQEQTINQQIKQRKAKSQNPPIDKNIAQGHTQICWYYYKQYPKRDYRRLACPLKQQSFFTLLEINPSLRNFTLADLSESTIFNEKIQQVDLKWFQSVTLGHYTQKLQPIPQGILKKMIEIENILSFTFVNLHICQLLFSQLFKKTLNLESLILQFCTPLSNFFYKNLPKKAPNLTKLSVNNLTGIEGEFISKLKHLQTLIIPWSQINMGKDNNNNQLNKQQQQQSIQEQFTPLKLKHINLYGCKWQLQKEFFLMLDPSCIESLNLGKVKISQQSLNGIIVKLCQLPSLTQLCLDSQLITNKHLLDLLKPQINSQYQNSEGNVNVNRNNKYGSTSRLQRLSVAHCQNLNLQTISAFQWGLFNNLTHLDIRCKNVKWNQNLFNLRMIRHLCFSFEDDIQKSIWIQKMAQRNIFLFQ